MNYADTVVAEQEAKGTNSFIVGWKAVPLIAFLLSHGMPSDVPETPGVSLRVSTLSARAMDTGQFTAPVVDRSIPWQAYLKSITEPLGSVGSQLLGRVLGLWATLRRQVGPDCPLPITQLMGDGAIQLAWDNGRKYVDVEVLPDGNFHWYFRDRDTGEVLGTEDEPIQKLAPEFFSKLTELAQTRR